MQGMHMLSDPWHILNEVVQLLCQPKRSGLWRMGIPFLQRCDDGAKPVQPDQASRSYLSRVADTDEA